MTTRGNTRGLTGLLVLVLVSLGLLACNQKVKVTDKQVNIIDDVQLAEMMAGDEALLIIDARPDYRYRIGHLPGAINIPLPKLNKDDPRFVEGQHIVVYGDGPGSALSHAAAKKLLANANLVVSDFRGGMEMWKKAGRKTEASY